MRDLVRVQRSFGRSVYRRALAEGTAEVVTPAGEGGGDARVRRSGGSVAPAAMATEARLAAYRRRNGTARLTPRQRRRAASKERTAASRAADA